MTNYNSQAKREKVRIQGHSDSMDLTVKARVAAGSKARKPRVRLDPKERSWAHAYLKHAATIARLPYDGARESMQILARYHGMEVPEPKGAASRSGPAIELAKAIQAKTGIVLPA